MSSHDERFDRTTCEECFGTGGQPVATIVNPSALRVGDRCVIIRRGGGSEVVIGTIETRWGPNEANLTVRVSPTLTHSLRQGNIIYVVLLPQQKEVTA